MAQSEIAIRAQAQKNNIEQFEGIVDSPTELVQIYSYYLVDAYIQKNGITFSDDEDKDRRSEEIRSRIASEVQTDASLFDLADSIILQTVTSLLSS